MLLYESDTSGGGGGGGGGAAVAAAAAAGAPGAAVGMVPGLGNDDAEAVPRARGRAPKVKAPRLRK